MCFANDKFSMGDFYEIIGTIYIGGSVCRVGCDRQYKKNQKEIKIWICKGCIAYF